MSAELTFELAKAHTKSFADNVLHEHQNAMECFDCEEMLQAGIDAFQWISIAERVLRAADEKGLLEMTATIEDNLCQLWEAWLEPLEQAEEKIKQTRSNGFIPENLDEFYSVKEKAIEIVDKIQLINISRQRLFQSLESEK